MGYAEPIERLQSLPQEKQAEVFDFVEFLAARCVRPHGKPHQSAERTDPAFSEMSLRQALRDMEDEPVAYTRADLRDRRRCLAPASWAG